MFLVSHLCIFATLNKERNSSYLQLSRRLMASKNVGLGVSLFQKYTHSPAKKKKKKENAKKNQHVKRLRFSLNTNKYKYPKNCPFKIACSRP